MRKSIPFRIWLIFAVIILASTSTFAQKKKELNTLQGEVIEDFNMLQGQGSAPWKSAGESDLIDKGDYYFLNSGDKVSFLRMQKTYVLVVKEKKKFDPNKLKAFIKKFGAKLKAVQDHALGDLLVLKFNKKEKDAQLISEIYQFEESLFFISPVLVRSQKHGQLAILPQIIVSIKNKDQAENVFQHLDTYGLYRLKRLAFTDTEFVLQFKDSVSDISKIFETTREIADLADINWAEPNFLVKLNKMFMPDDPLFGDQWHLHNTGQNGALTDADIDAPEGWDIADGTDAVIAIYDDSVDTSHEDLAIWSNPGETGGGMESDGIDNDGNGYVDDYQGWDFEEDDNNPAPSTSTDNHGTSCAGVAGAIGDNATGVSGSAPGAYILPVRLTSGDCSDFADAMRYAGKYADVVSCSWSISGCESELNSAIWDVVQGNIVGARRGNKGTPIVFASGNNASGWVKFTLSNLPAGTWSFQWVYEKDASVSQGYDTVWLDDIAWPGGTVDFNGMTSGDIPAGFASWGGATWHVVSDGVHARGAMGKAAKAGTIGVSNATYLELTATLTTAGALSFWAWVSSEQGYDIMKLYAINEDEIKTYGPFFNFSPGQYGHQNEVGFPASNPDTVAVGGSKDGGISGMEERVYYSQFGPEVDVVSPTSGGINGITTTDRMGATGYSTSDYTSSFGGTSAATPLTAGILASIISYNKSLTADEARNLLHAGADKIGPYAYPGGRNNYYGFGRVNLYNSLLLAAIQAFDYNYDRDTDGSDLAEYAAELDFTDITAFAARFGQMMP